MTHVDTRRLRDPVHGLIVFNAKDSVDMCAWKLIDTPEFQRLRRIKQLGFSEFVFPGATHSRFAHSIGVFHTARQLVRIIERELGAVDPKRTAVATLAALLHDLGHGPFSHTFEEVQKSRGVKKEHEEWTAEIILNSKGEIKPILDQFGYGKSFAKEIAALLLAETPKDIYHAIVSSSFDADRLDYLRRDRMMTGSGAGAIDFDWLLDNVRIASIHIGADEDKGGSAAVQTFCLDRKALQAAETFLLARYHLFDQVYLHKTTRCLELMLGAALRRVAELIASGSFAKTGLPKNHPIVNFYAKNGANVENYLSLDDTIVWGALERMSGATDSYIKKLSSRILRRELYKCVDIDTLAQSSGQDGLEIETRLNAKYKASLGKTVFFDKPKLSIYGQVGAEEVKVHKRLSIQLGPSIRQEIDKVSETIKSHIVSPKHLLRYYLSDRNQQEEARKVALSIQ